MTEQILYLLLRQSQKHGKKLEFQVFLARLLVSQLFANLLCFCLVLETLILGLIISFAISKAEFIGGKDAIDLSE